LIFSKTSSGGRRKKSIRQIQIDLNYTNKMSKNTSFFSYACDLCNYEVQTTQGSNLKLKKRLHKKVCPETGRTQQVEVHNASRNNRFNAMVGQKSLTWTPYDPADPTQEKPDWKIPVVGGTLNRTSQIHDTQISLNETLSRELHIPIEDLPLDTW
jgi:hypothetical protein